MLGLQRPLSPNFTVWELVRSQKAVEIGAEDEQYNPDDTTLNNLRYLANSVLQPLRDQLGVPLVISSGYRCEAVNTAVGGAPRSQHRVGQAADCKLMENFLVNPATLTLREEIEAGVLEATGFPIRGDVNANFYLFALLVLSLDTYDIDQLIHEFGSDYGRPAWVHVSASNGQNGREILVIGNYPERIRRVLTREQALALGI